MNTYNEKFWSALDGLVAQSQVVIDRPRGSRHPRFPEIIYPLDYGYLEGTAAMDGDGIDIWQGSDGSDVGAIVSSVDLVKKDSEIKLLIGCTQQEQQLVYEFHNQREFMAGVFVPRPRLTKNQPLEAGFYNTIILFGELW